MHNNWLPYEAREPVETASFWAVVDRENRRHEDGRQVQDVSIQHDPCMEFEAEVAEAHNCNDDQVEHHATLTTSPTPQESVEDDGDTHLGTMDADGSNHEESMSDTRRARKMRPLRPIMVSRASKITKKKRLRRKFATARDR